MWKANRHSDPSGWQHQPNDSSDDGCPVNEWNERMRCLRERERMETASTWLPLPLPGVKGQVQSGRPPAAGLQGQMGRVQDSLNPQHRPGPAH